MKLDLSALKIHLAHCANTSRIGHVLGLAFTASGIPDLVVIDLPKVPK